MILRPLSALPLLGFCSLFFFSLAPKTAGAWTTISSGVADTHRNPWFIGSSPVHYCVRNELGPRVSDQDIRLSLKKAIAFWKRDLQGKENEVLQIAQNEWREVACNPREGSPPPDISFFFGWKSLSRRQKEWTQVQGHPESMVLLENYDPQRLRGQGLVFLSWGSSRDGESGELWKPLWGELRLIHELGFVHGYFGPRWGIDSASFGVKGKQLLSLRSFSEASGFLPPILSSQLELESCNDKTCLEIRGPNFENRYYLARKKGDLSEELGWVSFSKNEPIEKRVSHPITLLLTPQQNVFPEGTESLSGPGLWEWEGPAQFSTREKNKNSQSVYLILNPRSFRLVQGGGKGSKARVLYSGHLWNPSLQSWSRTPSQLSPELKGENRKKTTIFIRERDAKKAKLFLQDLSHEGESDVQTP